VAEQQQIAEPPQRDPLWFAPVFVLAPARSNSTVVTAMLGAHPELHAFPELAAFGRATVGNLMVDPPRWRGAPARQRVAGLLRALAQLHDGEQTSESIAAAREWLEARHGWKAESLFDHLLTCAAPLIGVEKSPESPNQDRFLERICAAYPRARFLHLTRHPVASVESMHRSWIERDHWTVEPELFHNFCAGVWYHQHSRIDRLLRALPPDRGFRVRSEDLLSAPHESLPALCRWLAIDGGEDAVEAMSHPERWEHAALGPEAARGGGDGSFMRNPARREPKMPASLERPAGWTVDPWQWLSVMELAGRFGYAPGPPQ
jgi:hypothetical protein